MQSCEDTIVRCMCITHVHIVHTCLVPLTLPLLQEWFSTSILLFASELPSAPASSPSVHVTSVGIPPMPEASVQALMQLAQEFEELANTCLLVLHLEVSCLVRCVAAVSLYFALCTSPQGTFQILCVCPTCISKLLGEAQHKQACVFLP